MFFTKLVTASFSIHLSVFQLSDDISASSLALEMTQFVQNILHPRHIRLHVTVLLHLHVGGDVVIDLSHIEHHEAGHPHSLAGVAGKQLVKDLV